MCGEILFLVIENFYYSGEMGKVTLPEWLDMNAGVVAFFIVLIAIPAFWLAEKTERDWEPNKNLASKSK